MSDEGESVDKKHQNLKPENPQSSSTHNPLTEHWSTGVFVQLDMDASILEPCDFWSSIKGDTTAQASHIHSKRSSSAGRKCMNNVYTASDVIYDSHVALC